MKFTINASEFSEAVQAVSRIISEKMIYPVLKNLLIKAEDDHVIVFGFDGAMAIKVTCNSKVEEEGSFLIPAVLLNEILSRAPNSPISLKTNENLSVELKSKGWKFSLQGIEADDYYYSLLFDTGKSIEPQSFEVQTELLLNGLKTTLGFCSKDKYEQILSGIHFCYQNGKLELTATDKYRIIIVEKELQVDHPFDLIIPNKTLTEVLRAIEKNKSETIRICLDEVKITFEVAGVKVTSRLLEGTYPPCSLLIPKEMNTRFHVDRLQLADGLERIQILAKRNNNISELHCDYENQQIKLMGYSEGVGIAEELIPAQIKSQVSKPILLNTNYLLDGLKVLKSSEVRFSFEEVNSQIFVQPIDDNKLYYIVIPIRR